MSEEIINMFEVVCDETNNTPEDIANGIIRATIRVPFLEVCKECGLPADPEFTMDFTNVEPGAYIYWCATCGEEAQEMKKVLDKAFAKDPGFAQRLELEIDRVQSGGEQ